MSIIDTVLGMTDLDEKLTAKMAELGVSIEDMKALKAKYDELSADGSITKDEVLAQVKAFATEKGVSSEMVDKVMGMFGSKADDVAEVAAEAASDATDTVVEAASDIVDTANDTIAK